MARQQGGVWFRGFMVVILLTTATALLISMAAPIAPDSLAIGESGLLSILDIREGGNVGERPEGTTGDNELNIVAVPFIYETTTSEGDRWENEFDDLMDHLKGNLSTKTPFSEASNPSDHIEITTIDRSAVTNPSPTSTGTVEIDNEDIDYHVVPCSDIHTAAETAVANEGLTTYADKIVAYVNGTPSSGEPIILENLDTVGCADGIGGDIAAFERSKMQNKSTIGVGLHELGHSFGLCHNEGVDDINGFCDLSETPSRPSICDEINSPTNDGKDSIMNYCLPLRKFSGDAASYEDEYPRLEEIFAEQGWLYAN